MRTSPHTVASFVSVCSAFKMSHNRSPAGFGSTGRRRKYSCSCRVRLQRFAPRAEGRPWYHALARSVRNNPRTASRPPCAIGASAGPAPHARAGIARKLCVLQALRLRLLVLLSQKLKRHPFVLELPVNLHSIRHKARRTNLNRSRKQSPLQLLIRQLFRQWPRQSTFLARRTYFDTVLRETEHPCATARSPRPQDHFRRNTSLILRINGSSWRLAPYSPSPSH